MSDEKFSALVLKKIKDEKFDIAAIAQV